MIIKKYISDNLKDGKLNIFTDLGENAVILSTRKFKDTNNKISYEIVAATEDKNNDNSSNKSSDEVTKLEVNKLDDIWNYIVKVDLDKYYDTYPKLIDKLKTLGFSSEFILEFFQNNSKNKKTEIELKKFLLDYLNLNLVNITFFQKNLTQKIFNFIGLPGSGKTLALIKFGAIYNILNNSKVLVISNNNRSFIQAEILSAYCKLAEFDFLKANDNLNELIKKNKEYDLILIESDLSFSHNNSSYQNILVLDSTSNFNLNLFSDISYDLLVATKLDISKNDFSYLEYALKRKSKIVFLSAGINIPDDITLINEDFIQQIGTLLD